MNIQGFNPATPAPVLGSSANAVRPMASGSSSTSGTTGSSSSSNGTSPTDLQSTFLNLLVTELQNQDPTQPVDPTEMVSQMVSLNQLDQLISINQTLSGMTGTSSTTGTSGNTGTTGGSTPTTGSQPSASPIANTMRPASPLAASFINAASELPVAPAAAAANAGLMNLYGSLGTAKPTTYPTYTGVR